MIVNETCTYASTLYSVFDSRNGYQPILDNLQKEKGKWLTFLNPQPILVNLQKGFGWMLRGENKKKSKWKNNV